MSRKPRLEYYGALYHIKCEGNSLIFGEDEDKMKLLAIVADAKEVFDFKLLSYCIMDDDYDLIIKTHNIHISKIMQRINMIYSRYFNNKYKKSGSQFKGRYKSSIIDNDFDVLNTLRYVHNLPVQCSCIDKIEEYKWSSDIFFRMNLESIVDIEYALDIFSDDRYVAIEKYNDFMNFFEGNYNPEREYHKDRVIISLDEILRKVCPEIIDFDLIKSGSKKAYLKPYKLEYIKESKKIGFSSIEIGKNIGISDRAIRKHLSKLK